MKAQSEGLSLYRRFRPQRFSEVVGQDPVVATLKRAVALGKLHHAYLLAGQRGVGKTTLARLLARAANCLAPEKGEPCNRCDSCLRILKGQSLDVIEIDGASNRGIDQIRQLREEVAYVPAGSRYKAYIIDEVHMLTGEAFNALLKTLEEPPPHVLFIFATTEPHKVPATVLSRCQAFQLLPIPEEAIAARLTEIAQATGIALDSKATGLIARRSQGALRDALVILEQLGQNERVTEEAVVELLGLFPLSQVDDFLAALSRRDADRALGIVGELSARGRDLALFLEEGAARARDRIIAGEANLIPIARRLLELRGEIGRAFSRRLHLEVAITELCGPPKAPTPAPKPHTEPAAEPEPLPPEAAAPRIPCSEDPRPADAARAAAKPGRETGEQAWREMLAAILAERVDVAAFLMPAKAMWADGLLTVRIPAGYGYHYESLLEPEVWAYVEAAARRFFNPILAVQLLYEGNSGLKPTLDEGARLLAQALEGTILKEEDHEGR